MRRPLLALTALAAAGALAAGCGGTSGSKAPSSAATSPAATSPASTMPGGYGSSPGATAPSGTATVTTSQTKFGTILVDGSGRTLYLFAKDTPNNSTCTAGCVVTWPVDHSPAAPKAGKGVQASLLGTIKRHDGTTQVTYNKHPLYRFSGDRQPGQQRGQGLNVFGAKWWVVSPSGARVAS